MTQSPVDWQGAGTVHIAQLDCDLPRVSLGTAAFSHAVQQKAFAVLDEYRRLGGRLIDTARVYQRGEAEALVGRWLADRDARRDIVLMDKACVEDGSLTPDGVREAIQGCLERLSVDYLDIFTVHRDHPHVAVEPIVEALNEEISRGRIRSFGLSNWSVPRLSAAVEYAQSRGLRGPAVSSPHVSLGVPMVPLWQHCLHATKENLAWHAAEGIPVLAWSPLAHGFFSDHPWPAADSQDLVARSYGDEDNAERLSRARQLAAERGASAAEIALAYVLNLPAPVVAVVGALTPGEVASAFAAAQIRLSTAEMDWLQLSTDLR